MHSPSFVLPFPSPPSELILISSPMTNSKRWIIKEPITPEADANLTAFPPILRQLLVNRGYTTDAEARVFLKAETIFSDPFQLTGMRAAIERICSALEQKEPIAIYGDYDVDGVTATALLVQTLRGVRRQSARLHPASIR